MGYKKRPFIKTTLALEKVNIEVENGCIINYMVSYVGSLQSINLFLIYNNHMMCNVLGVIYVMHKV